MNILMYSGGKDSTATVILCYLNKIPIDLILMCEVMFDENTSAENPEHIKFVKEVAFPLFESWGYKTKIIRDKKTFVDMFYRVKIRGKNVGTIYGFPIPNRCFANVYLKVRPIDQYLKGKEYTSFEGIAYDEPKRLVRMKKMRPQAISILEQYKYTANMCYHLCNEYGLLSPIYQIGNRNGCFFCPNMNMNDMRILRKNHNELWLELLKLEEAPNKIYDSFGYGKKYSDYERMFQTEDNQITIFDILNN